jgi:RimJ/RimL family protein N-acetyltransferase
VIHLVASGAVFLRPFERSDAAAYRRWSADAEVIHLASLGPPLSLVQAEHRVEQLAAEHGKEAYDFAICLVDGERPIGAASLFRLDLENGSAELGISIGEKDEWGKGYGTDAVRALVDFGFGELRLERIHLEVWTENPRARRVYEKVGFVHEGTLRHDRFEHGEHTDGDVMSMLREEWLDRRRR